MRPGISLWVRKTSCRREQQPTPVLFPGEFHGQRNPAGYSPWGHRESDMTEWLTKERKNRQQYPIGDWNPISDFNTPFSTSDTLFKQKMGKDTMDLNNTTDQMNLTNSYKTFHATVPEYSFFSSEHRTLSRIGPMLDHKASLKTFKKNWNRIRYHYCQQWYETRNW